MKINVRNRKRTDGTNNWEYYFEIAEIEGKRKRISKSGYSTKKEAYQAGLDAAHRYETTGQTYEPSTISVADYLDLWMAKYCEAELDKTTIDNYRKKITNYIKPVIGKYRLSSISPINISDLLQKLKKEGLSRNTIVSVKAILSGAFSYAVSPLQYIQNSPCVYVKMPKMSETEQKECEGTRSDGKVNGNRKGSNPHCYIPNERIREIFERFPEGHPDHIGLMNGYKLGARIGEAYALTVEDFDFEKMTVKIDKQVQWNEAKKCWYFKPPKYKSVRELEMDEEYARLIERKIAQIQADKDYYGEYYTSIYLNSENELNDAGDGREIHLINVRENGTFISPSNDAALLGSYPSEDEFSGVRFPFPAAHPRYTVG